MRKIVRRGEDKTDTSVVRWRRAMVVLASAGGNTVEAIARLVRTPPDRVRWMIHGFNGIGMASFGPKWAGGRPRLTTTEDEKFIVKTAKARPEKVGRPYSHWSMRKLARYLAENPVRPVKIGRERLRQLLDRHGVTFQKTKNSEGAQRRQGGQARSHRGGPRQAPRSGLCLRRARASGHPSHRRALLGGEGKPQRQRW